MAAASPPRWVYRVAALELRQGGCSSAWEAAEGSSSEGACLVEVQEGQGAHGAMLAQLNAALAEEGVSSPALQPAAVAQLASLLTRSPVEFDKASFPRLKNPQK